MNFTPNFAGIISALKYIIENGISGSGGGNGGGGSSATATKQDEQTAKLTNLEADVEEIRGNFLSTTNLLTGGIVNINNSIGSQNDGAASSDNPPFASLISLFKRLLQRLTVLLPQSNGKLSVESDLLPIFELPNLSVSAVNADLLPSTDVSNYRYISLHVFGTFNAVYQFQGSNNGTDWQNITAEVKSTTDTGTFNFSPAINTFPISTKFIRVRISTYTSGTVQAHALLYKNSPNMTHQTGVFRTTGNTLVSSLINHDSPVSTTQPVVIGGVARLGNITAVQNDDVARLICTLNGALITMPYSMPEQMVQGFVDVNSTSDVELLPAAGLNVFNNITNLIITNSSATATIVIVKNGVSSIHKIFSPANSSTPASFKNPLRSNSNTAINIACSTATPITVNVSGFKN